MRSQQVVLELPQDLVEQLSWPPSQLAERIRLELAVHLFQTERLTAAQARRLAGLERWDFIDELRARRVPLRYDVAQAEEDLATAEALGL